MRKSLIITVVIALLCLCGCEADVTIPESPEANKASEMLLTTTAAEESADKLEATTTSSVEIDVPEKNEEESGTPTEDVVSVDNTVDDIAQILGIGRTSAYILVKEGHFKIVRIGNAIRISKRSFDEWLDSLDL